MRTESDGYHRDHLRALAQRVEVDAKEVRIMGSKSVRCVRSSPLQAQKNGGFRRYQFCTKWRDPWHPVGEVVAVPGERTDPIAIAPADHPIAVVLDPMRPLRAGGDGAGQGRQAGRE
jgi:hypothetical protein